MRSFIRLNGENVLLPMQDELPNGDFFEWVKKAEDEEIVAVIARCAELAWLEGADDAQVQKVVNEVTEQLAMIRGQIEVH